jgi:hypothetical protein
MNHTYHIIGVMSSALFDADFFLWGVFCVTCGYMPTWRMSQNALAMYRVVLWITPTGTKSAE